MKQRQHSSLPNRERSDLRVATSESVGDRTHAYLSKKASELVGIGNFPLYFASIYAMQFHPGAGTRGHRPLSARQAALEALDMCEIEQEVRECL